MQCELLAAYGSRVYKGVNAAESTSIAAASCSVKRNENRLLEGHIANYFSIKDFTPKIKGQGVEDTVVAALCHLKLA